MQLRSTADLLRKIRRIEMQIRRTVDSNFIGEYHSAFKGQGMEFDEVRLYQPGDDVRAIDWNVTARSGQVFIKKFREEREQTLFILFDISGSQDFGPEEENKREVGTIATGILSFAALHNGDKIGMATFSEDIERYFKPAKGRKHILAMVSDLLTHRNTGYTTDLTNALDFVKRVLRRKSILIVVSDFLAEGYEPSLQQLARKHDVHLLRIFHPNEMFHTSTGTVPVVSIETGRMVWINAGDGSYRNELNERFWEIDTRLRDFSQRNGIVYDYINAHAHEGEKQHYLSVLKRMFKRKG